VSLGWVVLGVSKDHTGFILRVKQSWTVHVEGTAILPNRQEPLTNDRA